MTTRIFLQIARLAAVMVLGYAVGYWFTHENTCRPEKLGQMRVLGKYGGTVEVCNGTDWVPATMPVPK